MRSCLEDSRYRPPWATTRPDWAVAFRDDSGLKHLFFVAETKGTLESFDLRGIENSKIACTKRLFNDLDLADGARYEQATTYQTLLRRGESPAVIKGNRCDGDESAMDIAITTFFCHAFVLNRMSLEASAVSFLVLNIITRFCQLPCG